MSSFPITRLFIILLYFQPCQWADKHLLKVLLPDRLTAFGTLVLYGNFLLLKRLNKEGKKQAFGNYLS